MKDVATNIDAIVGIVFGVLALFSILSACVSTPVVITKQKTKKAVGDINNKIEVHKFIANNTNDTKLQAACNEKVQQLKEAKKAILFKKMGAAALLAD